MIKGPSSGTLPVPKTRARHNTRAITQTVNLAKS
jgi:hypothetical protein